MPQITPLYAGLIALILVALSFRVIQARLTHNVSVGDGGERAVVKAMRAQSNCAEYAPIGIILLALAEMQGMPGWLVHLFGLTLLAGRALHAWGFGRTPQVIPARVWGMYLTFTMLTFTAIANIGHAIF
ncbi:MAG: hypothetical protein GY717_09785 [Rhodobacteraceae bacterium]|nr:hypothetical protein [Paracoccaceae bacterium]